MKTKFAFLFIILFASKSHGQGNFNPAILASTDINCSKLYVVDISNYSNNDQNFSKSSFTSRYVTIRENFFGAVIATKQIPSDADIVDFDFSLLSLQGIYCNVELGLVGPTPYVSQFIKYIPCLLR